jgi:RecA-family ATPase
MTSLTDIAKQFQELQTELTAEAKPPRKTRWNISELLSTDFPDPTGPLPGIIPTGLTLLGGRPKRGKSWLMLQFAYSLSIGGKFLDHDLKQSRVLYYALEDSPRRLKDRLSKFNPDPAAMIDFEREIKPLHLGGLEQIDQAADNNSLIVIDTLGRAMPGKDMSKEGAIFAETLGRLQEIALEKNISIVIILHTRKPNGIEHDPIDDILGSTQGLTASPDCVLALYKEQGKTGTQLEGRGRDFDDIDLTIEFDPITCAWQLVGETGEIRKSENEDEILEALQGLGKARVSAIVKIIGQDQGNTSRRLANLWTRGIVKREVINGISHYYLPTQDT